MKNKHLIIIIVLITSSCLFSQTGHWEQLFPQNSPHHTINFGMAQLTRGKVLVLTGFIENNQIVSETWLFDMKLNNWTQLNVKNPPPSRKGMAMTQLSDGKIIMFGGNNGTQYLNDTWLFDMETMDWSLLNTDGSPFKRDESILSKINDNDLILYGGDIVDAPFSGIHNDTWIFSFKDKSWRAICLAECPMPSRQGMQMSQISIDNVLLFGGTSTKSDYNDNWIFNRNNLIWTKISPIENSIPISYSSMVKLRDNFVLWSGGVYQDSLCNYSWIYNYDKNVWKKISVSNAPLPRDYHNLALIDSNKILLFGGSGPHSYYNDTWLLTIDSLAEVADQQSYRSVFEISPNPASDFIEVPLSENFQFSESFHVEIMNLYGQGVLSVEAIHELSLRIDVSELPSGMYFVRIGDRVGKFVKL